MTSFEMHFLVRDQIRQRMREAEQERLARLAERAPGDQSRRPPRGPLFGGLGRVTARFGGLGRVTALRPRLLTRIHHSWLGTTHG